MLPIKQAIKRRLTVSPQITCTSALPDKTEKHENHIFTQLDCVIHTMHLCAVFLKEQKAQLSLRDRATRACQLKSGKVLHKCRRLVFEKL